MSCSLQPGATGDERDDELRDLQPPTAAERAFDEYLDAVNAGEAMDTGEFIQGRPLAERLELEALIDDWNGLRSGLGGDEDLIPGSSAGGYRVLKRLGQGGMGSVYAAEHSETKRPAALKVLSKQHRYSDEAWARFERESRLAAGINHPRCVFVYGVVDFGGRPAIAMERMSGGTLQDEIEAGEPLPVARAVDLMLQILAGLEAAHEAGVLHRDVKPANCFFDGEGGVKIGDFGIARCLTHGDALTNTGQFLGSPLYAAPEQMRGDEVDERTDVYSAGATLFALVTGSPPYQGKGLGEVISRVLADPVPSARKLNPEVPRDLERSIQRALAKKPENRLANVALLIEELKPFASGSEERRSELGLAGYFEGARWRALFRKLSSLITGSEYQHPIPSTNYARPRSRHRSLGRFVLLGQVAPTLEGAYHLAHDDALKRRLWLHVFKEGFEPEPPEVVNPAALRWIEDGEDEGQAWRAFEDPGGVPLNTYAIRQTPIPWPRLRSNLIQLCDALEGPHPVAQLSRLWIGRQGGLRILEYTIDRHVGEPQEPRAILQRVAATFLTQRDTEQDLRPGYASSIQRLQRRLIDPALPFASVKEARALLEEHSSNSSGLSRPQRLAPVLLLFCCSILTLVLRLLLGVSEVDIDQGVYEFHFMLLLLVVAGGSTAIGFVLRNSPWALLAGMELRCMDGTDPGRLRCALRSFFTSAAAVLLMVMVFTAFKGDSLQLGVFVTFIFSALTTVGFPAQNVIDRGLTGTYVAGR